MVSHGVYNAISGAAIAGLLEAARYVNAANGAAGPKGTAAWAIPAVPTGTPIMYARGAHRAACHLTRQK